MGFKYSCFISYRHGQYELTRTFIEQLYKALSNELEQLVGPEVEVYVDRKRLEPGYFYNPALAEAICQSICMVVVYSPSYEESEYCKREFEAMNRLQQQRFGLLETRDPKAGMIIPVLFRGVLDDLPSVIRGNIQVVDFSQFALVSPDISRHPEWSKEIRRICDVVYRHYKAFRDAKLLERVCEPCGTFKLPDACEVPDWYGGQGPLAPVFPGR